LYQIGDLCPKSNIESIVVKKSWTGESIEAELQKVKEKAERRPKGKKSPILYQ
jgi:hypothetical protein